MSHVSDRLDAYRKPWLMDLCEAWEFELTFSPTASTPAWPHRIKGTMAQCVEQLEDLLKTRTPEACFLSWSIGAGVGGVWIENNQTLRHVLGVCERDLAEPTTAFEDPNEEAVARAIVPAMLEAIRMQDQKGEAQ